MMRLGFASLIWPMAQLGSPFTDGASQMRGYKRKSNVQTWRNWAFITLQLDGLLLQYSMKDKRDRLFLFPLFSLSPASLSGMLKWKRV